MASGIYVINSSTVVAVALWGGGNDTRAQLKSIHPQILTSNCELNEVHCTICWEWPGLKT
jgi:hypothetical protein